MEANPRRPPQDFCSSKANDHRVRRAEWLIAQNISDWFNMSKDYLIKHGFVKDEPGYICEFFCFVVTPKNFVTIVGLIIPMILFLASQLE